MRLTALDVKKKEFQTKMRGADPDQVRRYLEEVSVEIETLTREKLAAQEKAKDCEQRLLHFLALEQTLEKTLVGAQQTSIKMEEQARREAELILQSALLEREKTTANIRFEMDKTNRELITLRAEYGSTLSRMRALLSGFGQFIDAVSEPTVSSVAEIETTQILEPLEEAVSATEFAPFNLTKYNATSTTVLDKDLRVAVSAAPSSSTVLFSSTEPSTPVALRMEATSINQGPSAVITPVL